MGPRNQPGYGPQRGMMYQGQRSPGMVSPGGAAGMQQSRTQRGQFSMGFEARKNPQSPLMSPHSGELVLSVYCVIKKHSTPICCFCWLYFPCHLLEPTPSSSTSLMSSVCLSYPPLCDVRSSSCHVSSCRAEIITIIHVLL